MGLCNQISHIYCFTVDGMGLRQHFTIEHSDDNKPSTHP